MRTVNRLLLTVLLVALLPAAVLAQDGGSETQGDVELGGWNASIDGSPDVVAEYLVTAGGPEIRANTDSILHWGVISFDAKFRDSADHSTPSVSRSGRSGRQRSPTSTTTSRRPTPTPTWIPSSGRPSCTAGTTSGNLST
jgi:hypothetical protein